MKDYKKLFQLLLSQAETKIHPRSSCLHEDSLIPLPDNFFFVLILARHKQKDLCQRAWELLERLLAFQISKAKDKGSFPHFIHQYPQNMRRSSTLDIVLVLGLLIDDFSSLMSKSLLKKLKASFHKALLYCTSQDLPPLLLVKLRIAQLFDSTAQDLDYDQVQELLEKELRRSRPALLGQALVLASLLDKKLKTPLLQTRSQALWIHAQQLWDSFRSIYLGPFSLQDDTEPQTSLYSLFMQTSHGSLPKEIRAPLSPLLFISLLPLPPPSPQFCQLQTKTKEKERIWINKISKKLSYSLLSCTEERKAPDLHSLYMLWGKGKSLGSFVSQDPQLELVSITPHELIFQKRISDSFDKLSQERIPLLSFYLQQSPSTKIVSRGNRMTCFAMGDSVEISTPDFSFSLVFSLIEGEGDFCGHCRPSSRPSRGKEGAGDHLIFLRMLRASSACLLQVSLLLKNENS